ncbi:sensor histidine kinase [Streptomyces atriruber]|uniref:sensor histidine kinase n=1 Tax=Streptomyces atriruber TaxID=545121 RepID=UPI0006E32594|nr:HAMP domain-containing sensor histidine kinase [Streptomyces atriruber]
MPRTLRARATAAAVLIMVVALSIGGGWLYVTLRGNLIDNAGARTELAARQAAADIAAGPGRPSGDMPEPDGGVDAVLVLDGQGRPLASTAPHPAARAAVLAGFRPGAGEDSAVRDFAPAPALASHTSVVAVVRTPSPDGDLYVYALTVLDAVADAQRALGVTVLVGGPLVVLLTGVIAWSVTGAALRPVESIRRELVAVTADRLSRRVPAPAGRDEITRLAETVNDTLERLEDSVIRQRQFVADASHELRNPIAAARAELELALLNKPDPATAASLGQAFDSTVRLERIAADLLLLARLDAQQPQSAELVDLSLLAAEKIARRRSARVPLVLVQADDPVLVRADPGQLERLLANLLDNAQRFADSEVRVITATDRATGTALLEVVDDGPGIPPEATEEVFNRFTRLEADRNRASGGTGLGLAIAREIARAHGGSLAVAPSERGARLVLRLPTADSPARS